MTEEGEEKDEALLLNSIIKGGKVVTADLHGDSSGWSARAGSRFSGRGIYNTGDIACSSTGNGVNGVVINSRLIEISFDAGRNSMLDRSARG